MAFDELAQRLFGARRAESDAILTDATTGTIHGVALTDSEGGAVTVEITADVTAPEPLEVGGETYFADAGVGVEIPTSESVRAGDEVLVSTYGAGTMRSPVVTAAVGSGDRMAAAISNAESLAEQAEAVASATGQHFWHDTDGVHVTEVPQTEWGDPTSPNYHSGANVLLNALGQLFRDGLDNILAILSGTTPGLAIYDGSGNTADHILAEFTSDHVRIGGNVPDGTGVESSVQFFDQTSTHASHMDASTSIDEQPADGEYGAYYDMRNETSITTSLDDDGRVVDTNSNGTASVQLKQWMSYGISDVNEQWSEVTAALVAHSAYNENNDTDYPQGDASLEVVATTGSAYSSGGSHIALNADALQLPVNGYTSVVMRQVLCALLRPSATYTPLVGTWNTGTANAWETAGFGVVVTETGNITDYIDTSDKVVGEFTALVGCTVRVSACVTWVDSVAGRRSVGAFVNATRSGNRLSGGTEYSNSGLFYTGNNAKTAQLTPVVLHLAAGNRLNIGKYAPANAVQSNQAYKMNWVTIEVLSVD